MKLIKTVLFFFLSLLSIPIFYYLLAFLFVLFKSMSDFWIILITVLGGGFIGLITVGYIQIFNKLILDILWMLTPRSIDVDPSLDFGLTR